MRQPLREIGLRRYLDKVSEYNRYFADAVEERGERPHELGAIIVNVLNMAGDAMAIASEFGLDLDDPEIQRRLFDPASE